MTDDRSPLPRAAWPDRAERRTMLRRTALLGAGVAGASTLARGRAPDPQTVTVDAAGGADYRRLDDAVARAPSGSTILVRRGLHEVLGSMKPAERVVISGEGPGTHVRLRDGANANVFHITAGNVVLQRMRIDGNGARQRLASGNAVMFDGVTGGAVIDCLVEAAAGYNIVAFPGSTDLVVARNRSERARKEGIELQGASHCLIEGNLVRDCEINGVLLWNSTGDCGFNTVRANVVSGSRGFGLLIQHGAHDNTIVGNVFRNSTLGGIVVDSAAVAGQEGPGDAPSNALVGNVVSESDGHGIFLNDVALCSVHGNVIRASRLSGLRAAGARFCTVTGNVVSVSGGPALDISGTGITCTGNVCRDAGAGGGAPQERAGISVRPDAQATLLANVLAGSPANPALAIGSPQGVTVGPNLIQEGAIVGPGRRLPRTPVRRLHARVAASETPVAHGLGFAPSTVLAAALGEADVWVTRQADARHVFLRASRSSQVQVLIG